MIEWGMNWNAIVFGDERDKDCELESLVPSNVEVVFLLPRRHISFMNPFDSIENYVRTDLPEVGTERKGIN